jgi:hypothetical protein
MFDLTPQNTIMGSMSDNRAEFDRFRLPEAIDSCENNMLNTFGRFLSSTMRFDCIVLT